MRKIREKYIKFLCYTKFMKQKGLACRQAGFIGIFLVLVLVIAVAGGAYYLGRVSTKLQPQPTRTQQPTQITSFQDSTVDWKTYTDINEKFLFKYPEEKYLLNTRRTEEITNEGKHADVSIQYCPTKNIEDCAFPNNFFGVTVYENSQNMSINSWLKTTPRSLVYQQEGKKEDRGKRYCYFNDPRTVQDNENFLGYTSTTYTYFIDQETVDGVCKGEIFEGGGRFKEIFVAKSDKIYWISINLASEDIYPELDQILYTFRFTQ